MADKVTPSVRSQIMRRVKGKDTKPEIRLRKQLWKAGIRGWRLHLKEIEGRPDIIFTKYKLAIFVDGCFWHGCTKCLRLPKSNVEYWTKKIERNMARDELTTSSLRKEGWTVLRFWEHEIRHEISRVVEIIKSRLYENNI